MKMPHKLFIPQLGNIGTTLNLKGSGLNLKNKKAPKIFSPQIWISRATIKNPGD